MNDDRDPWYDVPEYVLPLSVVLAVSLVIFAMGKGEVGLSWPF